MTTRRQDVGLSLLELVVAVAILGISAGIVGLTFSRFGPEQEPSEDRAVSISEARTRALELARPVTIGVEVDGKLKLVTALPDGGVVADSGGEIDRLSGWRTGHE